VSIAQEFAEHIERRRRRLARAQFWFRLRGPVSTQMLLWVALLLIAIGGLLGAAILADLAPR
jgi:hypothetical protein